jgi:hypothetical protein
MTEKEYNRCTGMILAGAPLPEEMRASFFTTLSIMESLLDEGDQEDYFGTEGWQHVVFD